MNTVYCKAGAVELSEKEAFEIYNNSLYVCTSTAIYQPHFSAAQERVYFSKIFDIRGLAKRGRFYKLTAGEVNKALGLELLKA